MPPARTPLTGAAARRKTALREAALQLAYGIFPDGHLPRLVVVSDGNETDGNVATEALVRAFPDRTGVSLDALDHASRLLALRGHPTGAT